VAGELGYDTGPYVNVAVFCERVLQEKDDVITLVRIVDQITVSVTGTDAPDELPPGAAVSTNLVISLRAGQATGKQRVQITFEHPDGSRHPGPELPVHFTQGSSGGANLILNMNVALSTTGIYWADILVNGRLVTRLPLEIRYQVIPPGIQTH
jgi:hypothetical protein